MAGASAALATSLFLEGFLVNRRLTLNQNMPAHHSSVGSRHGEASTHQVSLHITLQHLPASVPVRTAGLPSNLVLGVQAYHS